MSAEFQQDRQLSAEPPDEGVEDGLERQQLLAFLADLADDPLTADPSLTAWYQGVLQALTRDDPHPDADGPDDSEPSAGFEVYPLQATAAGRTYRLNVHQDKGFRTLGDRVRGALQTMLQRMVEGQLQNFIRYARPERGKLQDRRTPGLKFPHDLPYIGPEPTTIAEQIREEGGVVEAAVFFAMSSTTASQPRKLVVDAYAVENKTKLGKAPFQRYYNRRSLLIRLNTYAMRHNDSLGENQWAGVAGHEILHNLGWSHPSGKYTLAMPIEIYQACISGGHHLLADLER